MKDIEMGCLMCGKPVTLKDRKISCPECKKTFRLQKPGKYLTTSEDPFSDVELKCGDCNVNLRVKARKVFDKIRTKKDADKHSGVDHIVIKVLSSNANNDGNSRCKKCPFIKGAIFRFGVRKMKGKQL